MDAALNRQDRLTIPSVDFDLRKVLLDGHRKLDEAHAEKEAAQKGKLRAGSAGCIVDGTVRGECHRIAHLRHTGIDKPHTLSRKLMFQAGEANEDIWEKVLLEGWSGQVLRGQRFEKTGSWGTVMGSPDIVLTDRYDQRTAILELKLLSALWTTTQRVVHLMPDEKHLIQSTAYMWITRLPAILCYTSRTDFAIQFARKQLGIDKIEPCYVLFYLKVENDVLHWRHEHDAAWVPTDITVSGVRDYYQLVADMGHTKQLHGRPYSEGYDRCAAKYCAFSEACDRWERSYPEWRNEAKAAVVSVMP